MRLALSHGQIGSNYPMPALSQYTLTIGFDGLGLGLVHLYSFWQWLIFWWWFLFQIFWGTMKLRSRRLELTALAALSVFCYWRSWDFGFVFDDSEAVLNNNDVTTKSLWDIGFLRHDFWGDLIRSAHSHKSYRPITTFAFRWFFWNFYWSISVFLFVF